jgi:hypothetical protein
LPEGSGVHSLLKTALLLMLLVLIGVNNDEKGARLGGFVRKPQKHAKKYAKSQIGLALLAFPLTQ